MAGMRLAEMHAAAARRIWRARPHRRGHTARVALGLALIRLGTWAIGPRHRPLASRTS